MKKLTLLLLIAGLLLTVVGQASGQVVTLDPRPLPIETAPASDPTDTPQPRPTREPDDTATPEPTAPTDPAEQVPTATPLDDTTPRPGTPNVPKFATQIGGPPNVTVTRVAPPSGTPCVSFSDVPESNIFYPYIRTLNCYGAVGGYPDGLFHPSDPVSRAEIAKIFVISFNLPRQTPATPTFSDIPASHWAYRYVETAHTVEAMLGYQSATCQARGLPAGQPCFLPSDRMRRAELAALIHRARGWPDPGPPAVPAYTDVPANHWASLFVESTTAYGVFSGSGGLFRPNDNVRRDELCKVVYLGCAVDNGPCSLR